MNHNAAEKYAKGIIAFSLINTADQTNTRTRASEMIFVKIGRLVEYSG